MDARASEPLIEDVVEPQTETAEAAQPAVGKSSLLPNPMNLVAVLWRRIWVLLAVAALVLGAAFAYATFAPKMYTSTARVQIEPRRGDPVQSVGPLEQSQSSDFIETQILFLASPQILTKVVSSLNLVDSPEFGVAGEADEGANADAVQRARVLQSAQRLRSAVTIRRSGQTSLLDIVVSTRIPALSARIANEYVRQYLLTIQASKEAQQSQLNGQIDSRLGQLGAEAERADAALQQYKIAHGLMSAEGATMAEQETSTLNQQVAQARATLAERQGRLQAARRQMRVGGGGSDVASALSSGTIGALRTQEADSSRNLAQLRERYGAKHPAVAQEERRLADVEKQIQREIDRIISSLEAEVNVAASGLSSLLGSQVSSKSRLASNAYAQVGFLELQRKAEAARIVYEAFLNKSRGTAARDGIDQPIASLASPAIPSSIPSSPNIRLIYLLGLMAALVGGILAVALAEFLDSGIKNKHDVERRLGARYLGSIPQLDSTLDGLRATEDAQDYIVSHPNSAFAESFRSLRAAVTLRGRRRPKVIAITSALPREGKTTVSVSLARTIAMAGERTILVDCDLRHHSASDMLLKGRAGQIVPLLSDEISLDSAILIDEDTGLEVIGCDRAPDNGRDLLTQEKFSALLAELRERYDYIILDTAPVLGIADARAVASLADAVILLARWRSTSLRATDTALDLLIDARAKVFGVALTIVNLTKFGSTGEDDLYGYHEQFKSYYAN